MKIEVLKSKISHIRVSESHINNEGVIRMSKSLMDDANLVNYEKVIIFNESGRGSAEPKFAFIEQFDKEVEHHDITTPIRIAGVNDDITIMSVGTATVDESFNKPILINMNPTFV